VLSLTGIDHEPDEIMIIEHLGPMAIKKILSAKDISGGGAVCELTELIGEAVKKILLRSGLRHAENRGVVNSIC